MLFMLLISSTYKTTTLEIKETFIDFKDNEWYTNINDEHKQKIMNVINLETRSKLVTDTIIKYAIDLDIPITLAISLAKNESNFKIKLRNRNRNRSYDYGLFQLNSEYRSNWTIRDYFDVDKNTKEGLTYFREMLDKNDTTELALASYNAGPTRVRRKDIPYSTFNYVGKIKNWKDYLEHKIRLAY